MADPKPGRRGARQGVKLAAQHREKIRLGLLLKRLEDNALGLLKDANTGDSIEMSSGQIQSALGVLRKVMPDLNSQALTNADGDGPAVVVLMKDGKGK